MSSETASTDQGYYGPGSGGGSAGVTGTGVTFDRTMNDATSTHAPIAIPTAVDTPSGIFGSAWSTTAQVEMIAKLMAPQKVEGSCSTKDGARVRGAFTGAPVRGRRALGRRARGWFLVRWWCVHGRRG